MGWYDKNNKKKSDTGRPVFSSQLPPEIVRSVEDIYFISKRGDRLDLYAEKYYKNPDHWRVIAAANNLGKGSLAVEPGLQIRIPPNPDDVIALMRKQNSER